jgi:predicted lipoprotein with Yx(FWY)xxD motif
MAVYPRLRETQSAVEFEPNCKFDVLPEGPLTIARADLMRTLGTNIAAVVAGVACACSAANADSIKSLKVDTSEEFGTYIVDGAGRPLYRFTKDRRAGDTPAMAGCYGRCQQSWPPAHSPKIPEAGRGVSQSTIATVMRNDATLQATYDGWPLYFFTGDDIGAPGPNGHNVNAYGGTWHLIAPPGELIGE